MWTLAWWWMFVALPLPWLVRRVVPAEPLDRDAALKAPVAAEFADLAGLRAPHGAPLASRGARRSSGLSRCSRPRGRSSSASPSRCR